MLASFKRLARQRGMRGCWRRDDQCIAHIGQSFERGEHGTLADFRDDLAGGFRVEIEDAYKFCKLARGELLGMVATKNSRADNANSDLALMATYDSGRSGRVLDTLQNATLRHTLRCDVSRYANGAGAQ